MLRRFSSTMLNLALLKVQNSPAFSGLKQLNFRPLHFDKHGDPKKIYSPLRILLPVLLLLCCEGLNEG
jgi:hypothetical protein